MHANNILLAFFSTCKHFTLATASMSPSCTNDIQDQSHTYQFNEFKHL